MVERENPPAESQPVRVLPVLGGAVLGFAATWVLLTVAILVLYGRQLTGAMEFVVPAVALFALPVLSGLLMARRSTRRWGAGFLIGVAIGSITGAGVCAGFMGINAM
jgi:hypothetical protein